MVHDSLCSVHRGLNVPAGGGRIAQGGDRRHALRPQHYGAGVTIAREAGDKPTATR